MEDLIKRDDAISKTFCASIDGVPRMVVLLDDIKAIPSADRPQGHYVKGKRSMWYCPECKRIYEWSARGYMKGADDE